VTDTPSPWLGLNPSLGRARRSVEGVWPLDRCEPQIGRDPRRRQGVFPEATPGGRLPASIRLGSVAESGDLSVVQFRATGVGVEDAVMQSVGGSRQSSPLQEVSATLAFLAATAELELFVALGSFDRQDAPLAPSVVATP
jgi:hypothetical protein